MTSVQKAFTQAKARAGVEKIGGIHGLRHAYATHQLEAGLPVHRLQRLLGHQDIASSARQACPSMGMAFTRPWCTPWPSR